MLFGKMIQLGSNLEEDVVRFVSRIEPEVVFSDDDCGSTGFDQKILCSEQNENRGYHEETTTEESMETKENREPSLTSVLEVSKTPTSPCSTDTGNPETDTKQQVTSSEDLVKKNQDQSDQGSSNSMSSEQNPLKKPEKIVPCARCNSMDTKFCYFNNYNVNQPRHFCKNCQRYWTAGGSMRNVPVGAGRRKSKNSAASQHRHLVFPEGSDGLIHHVMRPDGTILAFGMDSSVPNQSNASNGFFISENSEKKSSNCSIIENNSNGKIESSQAIPCIPYGWNPIPWQSGFPVSFYSTPSCNLQWLSTPSMNSDQSSSNSSPNSTSLGKHSRDENETTLKLSTSDRRDQSEEKQLHNSRVVVPKTLRIDDPSEAAKSSIWTTLGIKNDHQLGSFNGRVSFFGELQQAKGVNQGIDTSSLVLQTNPAAFSRSLSYHEVAQ